VKTLTLFLLTALLVAACGAPERAVPQAIWWPPATPVRIPLGTTVQLGYWELTVTGPVEFDAWRPVEDGNRLTVGLVDSARMVLVPLVATNRSAGRLELGLTPYVLGRAGGAGHSNVPHCEPIPQLLDFRAAVGPGETLEGKLCFVVDEADVASLVMHWPVDLFSYQWSVEFALR
jgi:hypothetical protein